MLGLGLGLALALGLGLGLGFGLGLGLGFGLGLGLAWPAVLEAIVAMLWSSVMTAMPIPSRAAWLG